MSKRPRGLCPGCLHGDEHHPDRGRCMYGHAREEGGTGTPGITGGCRCPKFGTPRSKMPDAPADEAELEIEKAVAVVQHALDMLCDVVKRRLRERRDATDIDPAAVLRRMPEILRDPPSLKKKPNGVAHETPHPGSGRGVSRRDAAGGMTPCERAILTALAQHGPRTAAQVAILAGYSESGSFSGALSDLRAEGLIARGVPIRITDEGREILGPVPSLPRSPAQLFEYWVGELDLCEGKILSALRRSGPLTPTQAAEATGYHESGSFMGALSKLRKLGLVQYGQPMRLAPELT